MTTHELISEVISLPVEQRLILAESLNPPDRKIDQEWIKVAQNRLVDLRSGKVSPISSSEVQEKVQALFS